MKIYEIVLIFYFIIFSLTSNANLPSCYITSDQIEEVFIEIKVHPELIKELKRCQKQNITLLSKLINEIDPNYLQYASEELKNNSSFISKFLPLNYKIIQYASDNLKNNSEFILNALRNNVKILAYADIRLLDNAEFAQKAIKINPNSYFYLSTGLQINQKILNLSLKYQPLVFSYIFDYFGDYEDIIKNALISHPNNFEFLPQNLRKEDWVKKYHIKHDPELVDLFDKYLRWNYKEYQIGQVFSKGYKINNQARNFANNRLFYQEYPTKWQSYNIDGKKKYKLEISTKNHQNWQEYLSKYPKLITKIHNFLKDRINQSTINSLYPISIWQINKNTFAINLYSIRNISDQNIHPEIVNINSFTFIATQKENNNWHLDIVNAIFNANIKTDIQYKNGHKRFYIWDLYKYQGKEAIIFKIEDQNSEYFKIFKKTNINNYKEFYQMGGYYETITIDPEIK